jgi:hypothetical protein
MLLDLAWRCRLDEAAWWHPEWLTVSKLEELGFDCSMPASSPHASEHYSAMQSIPVYVLLEFEGATWEKGHRPDDNGTRLIAIDAGRDPGRLRAKHPDKARCIMAHGLIRPFLLRKSDKPGEGPTQPPRIAGRIQAILPGQLFVPKPWNQVLQELRPRDFSEREALRHPPRYAVTVSWGADHLPWLRNVRLLPAPPPKSP